MAYRLSIGDLTVSLGDGERRFTLRAGDWTLDAGEVIGLTGASGTGKTLLLELLGLLRAPASGSYRADPLDGAGRGEDFASYWQSEKARALCAAARAQFFGFVPQTGGLLPFLSVRENVALSQNITKRIDPEWCDHLIARLGLASMAHFRPAALSIGQRQRVAIARALSHRPFCVIADEPTAALDPEAAEIAMGLLIEVAREGGAATLLSSHDLTTLRRFRMRRMRLTITSTPGQQQVISALEEIEVQDGTERAREVAV